MTTESKLVHAKSAKNGVDVGLGPGLDHIEFTVWGCMTLEVHGRGAYPEMQTFLSTHTDKFHKDEGFFLIMGEQWFRTRGFTAKVRPAAGLPLGRSFMTAILIWAGETAFRWRGIKVFESTSGADKSQKEMQ